MLMQRPACSPSLNSIEMLWVVIHRTVYANIRQFSYNDYLWNAQNAVSSVEPSTTKKLTESVTERQLIIVQNKEAYINK